MQNDILFDNIYIGHSEADAEKFAQETFFKKSPVEKALEEYWSTHTPGAAAPTKTSGGSGKSSASPTPTTLKTSTKSDDKSKTFTSTTKTR